LNQIYISANSKPICDPCRPIVCAHVKLLHRSTHNQLLLARHCTNTNETRRHDGAWYLEQCFFPSGVQPSLKISILHISLLLVCDFRVELCMSRILTHTLRLLPFVHDASLTVSIISNISFNMARN
jgi:hypothetical protein